MKNELRGFLCLATIGMMALLGCKKDKSVPCEMNTLHQMEILRVVEGFMPMSSLHYWIYADSAFVGTDSARAMKDQLAIPKQSFVYSVDFLNRPVMFQGLMEGRLLPDLAFYKDTAYLLNNWGMLRHGDCHQIGRPWLYPLAWGDTIFNTIGDGSTEKIFRSNVPVITEVGTFSDNYVVQRYQFEQFVFNRQIGLIEYRWLPYGPVKSRRVVLKAFDFPSW